MNIVCLRGWAAGGLRIAPRLTVSDEDIDMGLDLLLGQAIAAASTFA